MPPQKIGMFFIQTTKTPNQSLPEKKTTHSRGILPPTMRIVLHTQSASCSSCGH